jgi:hypothetical protein
MDNHHVSRVDHLPWSTSSVLLTFAGVLVGAIGTHFIVVRPALLPEDAAYMQFSATELATIGPRLGAWLTQVFYVLGGYALATGLLTVALAATSYRARHPIAVVGAFLAGASSIGLMAAVNFAIASDFRWFLLAIASVWAMSLIAFWIEARAIQSRPVNSSIEKGN